MPSATLTVFTLGQRTDTADPGPPLQGLPLSNSTRKRDGHSDPMRRMGLQRACYGERPAEDTKPVVVPAVRAFGVTNPMANSVQCLPDKSREECRREDNQHRDLPCVGQ